jgi:type IV secretory pathway TraG/TraD family ATPase VirD4
VPLSNILLFLLTPVTLMIAGIVTIGVISAVVGAIFAFFAGIPVTIFNQIFAFEHYLAVFRHQQRGFAGYIARAIYWLRNEPLPKGRPDDSKGARFATDDEIRDLHAGDDPAAMAFGHSDGEPLMLKTDKHVLIMASTRSGKGVTLIIPHLLRYRGSAFVLDPKGENAKATSRQRATMLNGKVHILDPFGITGLPSRASTRSPAVDAGVKLVLPHFPWLGPCTKEQDQETNGYTSMVLRPCLPPPCSPSSLAL